MKNFISLDEVRRRSILYLLYFYAALLVFYIFLAAFGVIQLYKAQEYVNIAILFFLLFLLWGYRRGAIGYRLVAYTLLGLGIVDTAIILEINYYNELRILWLLSLIPYAYLYGGRIVGLFTSVVTMALPLLIHSRLEYTTQALLTYEVTDLLISAASFFFIFHFEKLSQLIHKKQLQLNKYATIDFLTEILNRRGFFEEAEHVQDGVVGLFDLDNLKVINDTYGHKIGDAYIKFFVELLRSNIRGDDIFARFGGDEFIVIFKGANINDIEKWAQRFYKKLEETFFKQGNISLMVEVSSGFAQLESNLQESIERADVALYEAKRERDTYTIFR